MLSLFPRGFLVIFSWELTKLIDPIQLKPIIPWVICYGIIALYNILIAIFTKGIHYGVETGWIPVFSWGFAIYLHNFATNYPYNPLI